MENSEFRSLQRCHVHKLWSSINMAYSFLQMAALTAIFYYRGSFFFNPTDVKYHMVPSLPWFLIFSAELVLSFIWVLKQPFYWRRVTRTVFPEKLPKDEELPGIDVFVCTADPEKEPTLKVMNTVISAMALDYPARKLCVYLSDDAGDSMTLDGMMEAWVFATWWLPFCRRYRVKQVCPEAYFQNSDENRSKKFIEDRKLVQEKHEIFKHRVLTRRDRGDLHGDAKKRFRDHPALIQVINRCFVEEVAAPPNPDQPEMPLLVYVAREKRNSYPHHFKAGALNVLLRVSSILSNSPYILVLDCDMYCNDSNSSRQAMCFFLDSEISPSLGWVQYPQKFHNINESDIYDSQLRMLFLVRKFCWLRICIILRLCVCFGLVLTSNTDSYIQLFWAGADGIQGPIISGTNLYIRRESLYGLDMDKGTDLTELRESLGPSSEFLASLSGIEKPKHITTGESSAISLQEARFLASCTFEKDTEWGVKVGFWYDSLLEDVLTGLFLFSKGWRSVYMNPEWPQFLGSATTNLNDIFTQGIRWFGGFIGITLSKYYPLTNRSGRTLFLQKLTCSFFLCEPFCFLPALSFATVLPVCFLYGIPLYPQVSDPFMVAFAFAFLSSLLRHLYDAHFTGGSATTWLNEQRFWMIKSLSSYTYAAIDYVSTRLGYQEATFIPTNKSGEDDSSMFYQMGKYDFRTPNMFLVPVVTAVILNMASFVVGVARMIVTHSWHVFCAQLLLSFYLLLMSLPVIEAMFLRKDSGRIPASATVISLILSLALFSLSYLVIF